MLGLLNLRPRDTRHLVHFADFLIGCNQLDDADRWLAELKKVEPQGLSFLELEVRLLDLRKRRPEVLARLEAFGREFPNEIGTVADLLNRYGFPKEAEQAYRAFVAPDQGKPSGPWRWPSSWLARIGSPRRWGSSEKPGQLTGRKTSPPLPCQSTMSHRRTRLRDAR